MNIDIEYNIIETVCEHCDVEFKQLYSKSRAANIVEARQLASYFIYFLTEHSLKSTGRMLNRDHATVMHSIKVVRNQIEFNKKYREKYNLIYLKILFKSKSKDERAYIQQGLVQKQQG